MGKKHGHRFRDSPPGERNGPCEVAGSRGSGRRRRNGGTVNAAESQGQGKGKA